MLELIRSTAPMLFAPVSPVSRWTHRSSIDIDEFIGGGEYTGSAMSIRVLNRIKQQNLDGLKVPRANPGTFMHQTLMSYYAQNPATALPNSVQIRVRYYSKLTFISSATQLLPERCISFKTGDVVYDQPEGRPFRVDAVVYPTIQAQNDVFLFCFPLTKHAVDDILGQDIFIDSYQAQLLHISQVAHAYAPFMPYNPVKRPVWWRQNMKYLWRNEWFTAHY
jgi:hypothetical protein